MAAALAFSASSYVGKDVATLYGGGTGNAPWKLVSVEGTRDILAHKPIQENEWW